MGTFHRRQLRPRPLTATAAEMLRMVRATQKNPRTTKQLVESSGRPLGASWNALLQLQERQLVLVNGAGGVILTRAGAEQSGRTAA